jgi:hypothetical protein
MAEMPMSRDRAETPAEYIAAVVAEGQNAIDA